MNATKHKQIPCRPGGGWWSGAGGLLALSAATAWGAPPLDPLATPWFTVDPASPIVGAGLAAPDDVLVFVSPEPVILFPGVNLGLGMPGDDINALSGNKAEEVLNETFGLLFSVDRETLGLAPPDQALADQAVPYNVADQAARGHAAADQFMSAELFTTQGRRSGAWRGPRFNNNNIQVVNNYDEGGTSFGLDPPVSSSGNGNGQPQGNTNGTSGGGGSPRPGAHTVSGPPAGAHLGRAPAPPLPGQTPALYFCLAPGSPSLEMLPGNDAPSAAHLYFNPDPNDVFTTTTLFARFEDLGLTQWDDIDALMVFDDNGDGVFGSGDQVIFSLSPDSPSLGVIPGTSSVGAGADILAAVFGQSPAPYAPAYALGLGAALDDVDALELLICADATGCAVTHGIRRVRGDCNDDGFVTLDDFTCFVAQLSGPGRSYDWDGPGFHQVQIGAGTEFDPAHLTIEKGDTVEWVWVAGTHDVVSGRDGTPDGNFSSGPPTGVPGTTFLITFDQTFLAAHPMPADVYPYFCSVHAVSFGTVMVEPQPGARFDFEEDDDVDLADFGEFANKLTGPQ